VWSLRQEYINPQQIIHDKFIFSWSAKWLFGSEIMSGVLTHKEAKRKDDLRILNTIWKLLDSADIVIAHNAKRFDVPILNGRFLIHKMKPPMYYQTIDTLQIARSTFGFSSNKLDYINQLLEIDGKKETDFQLWVDCYNGDRQALRRLVEYNKHDVVILEELYVLLRPWIKSHPNLGVYVDTGLEVCPICGNSHLHWEGFYYTPVGRYEAFRCEICGAIGRRRTNDIDKEDRKVLVRN